MTSSSYSLILFLYTPSSFSMLAYLTSHCRATRNTPLHPPTRRHAAAFELPDEAASSILGVHSRQDPRTGLRWERLSLEFARQSHHMNTLYHRVTFLSACTNLACPASRFTAPCHVHQCQLLPHHLTTTIGTRPPNPYLLSLHTNDIVPRSKICFSRFDSLGG